jgi:hypothetical protein
MESADTAAREDLYHCLACFGVCVSSSHFPIVRLHTTLIIYSTSIATIVRIPFAKGYLDNPDYLYTTIDLGIWSTVEIGVALTTSSLATLKPLLKHMRLFNTTSSSERLGSDSDERISNTAFGRKPTVVKRVDTSPNLRGEGDLWRKDSMGVELVCQSDNMRAPSEIQDSELEIGYHRGFQDSYKHV